MTKSTVFISAVSSELKSLRRDLRDDLEMHDWTVSVQETLNLLAGDTLLHILHEHVRECDAVVCLVGTRAGAGYPTEAEVKPYAGILAAANLTRASYTQWEFLFARHYGKRPLVCRPRSDFKPDSSHPAADDVALQTAFVALIEEAGLPRIEFSGVDELSRMVQRQIARFKRTSDVAHVSHPAESKPSAVSPDAITPVSGRIAAAPMGSPVYTPVTHGLPPTIGARFVGRDDFLAQVRKTLTQSNTTAITAAISGMGGIGKTRAAAEYAWAHQADYPGGMFMIPAATADSLLTHLSNLTTPLGIPGMDAQPPDIRRAAVINWLRGHRDWLLILDHVDTDDGMQAAHDLRGDLPSGHVLLTSRLGTVADGFHRLQLGVLSPEAATRFLLTATDGKRTRAADDEAEALGLAQDLGRLALALTHAAAFIERHVLTLSAYRAELARVFEDVLGFSGKSVKDHADSTLATLEVSLARATPAGRILLELLAFLADEPVPRFLLEVPVPDADGVNPRDAEADLADYSLVTRDAESGSFITHRLVRQVVRGRLSPDAARERLEQALRWVNAAFVGNPQDVRTWTRLLPLAEHAEAVADRAAADGIDEPTGRLMGQLDMLFDARAQYARAERMSRAALAIGERSLGPDHPDVAAHLNNLASLLRRTNRVAEAEPLHRRALAIGERSLGPDHPTVAIRLNNLAVCLETLYGPNDAEPMYRRALAIDEASLGPDHPAVARDLNNLADTLRATGRLTEAEPLIRRALAIDEASLGPDHPNVATSLINLAALLRATNRLAEAEPLFRRALTIDEASYGLDHPEVATSLNNLAGLLRATNRLAEAEPLYRRALAIDGASLGPDHPNVATDLNNLADTLRATGRLAEAVPMFRRAVLILVRFQRATTHQHPNFDVTIGNYVGALQALGRTEAEINADIQAMAREAGLG